MDLKERGQIEPVRGRNQLQHLTLQHRRRLVVAVQPCRGVHDELHTHQPVSIPVRLVDQRLRLVGIQRAIQQFSVDVMHAHGPLVRAGNTTQKRCIAGSPRIVHVDVLLRRVMDDLHQLGGSVVVAHRVGLGGLRPGCGSTSQEGDTEPRRVRLADEIEDLCCKSYAC